MGPKRSKLPSSSGSWVCKANRCLHVDPAWQLFARFMYRALHSFAAFPSLADDPSETAGPFIARALSYRCHGSMERSGAFALCGCCIPRYRVLKCQAEFNLAVLDQAVTRRLHLGNLAGAFLTMKISRPGSPPTPSYHPSSSASPVPMRDLSSARNWIHLSVMTVPSYVVTWDLLHARKFSLHSPEGQAGVVRRRWRCQGSSGLLCLAGVATRA